MRTKKLYIIRGLPGSGKTTEARRIGCLVIEPQDQYSTQAGEYRWRLEDVGRADAAALRLIEEAMTNELDVAVAEILPKLKDIEPYLSLAKRYNYDVEVRDIKITIEESLRWGTHQVPETDTTQMAAEWEDWTSQDL